MNQAQLSQEIVNQKHKTPMPELPEVETIRLALLSNIEGQCISNTKMALPRMLLGISPHSFSRKIKGQSIEALIRRGKYLIFCLQKDSFIIHLGMTGQLSFLPALPEKNQGFSRTVTGMQVAKGANRPDKHTHLHITLDSGGHILFRDVRTFGKVIWTENKAWENHPRIFKLGLEPLTSSPKIISKKLAARAGVRNIKSLLLDQHVVAGIGNIYCDEALFMAGIHPEVISGDLTSGEWAKLASSIKKVLLKGIQNSGTSFSDYRKPDGSQGKNQERLMVYGRGGLPCRKCKKTLVKIVVSQRGTVYCPECQGG